MADPGLLLGLDAGNTVIKAVLFDPHGRQLAASKRDGASHTPLPGHVERDLARALGQRRGGDPRMPRPRRRRPATRSPRSAAPATATASTSSTAAGEPLLAIQSLDMRAADLAAELGADGNGDRLHAICLQAPWPSQTPTLLAWVRRHAPELYARAGTAFLCKDFVTCRLTGRRVSDISDMSGAGFAAPARMHLRHGAPRRLRPRRRRAAMLPDLVGPTEIVGGVTRRGRGGDRPRRRHAGRRRPLRRHRQRARLRRRRAGQASIIVGTWSINQVIAAEPIADPRIFMVSVFAPDRFMAIEFERHLRRQPRMVRPRAGRARQPRTTTRSAPATAAWRR